MSDTFDDRYSQNTKFIKRRVSDADSILDLGDESSENKFTVKPAFWKSVVAGGIAGIVVDFTLYPLDTLKTRLQSDRGFADSGGFRKLYKGILPILLCSAPVSALFFCVYNSIINVIRTEKTSWDPVVYIVAASAAEVICSTVRVPLEILKQRKQISNSRSLLIIQKAVEKEGYLGLYRGFSSTIAREVPFACIQFPLWEYMIQELIIYQNGEPLTALQTAYCGAIAGGIAGAVTTPMDVVKTRIMLAEKEKIEEYKPRVYYNFAAEVVRKQGMTGLFSGLTPRVLWIMLGGFIYFGTYEEVKLLCEEKWCFFKWRIQRFGKWLPSQIQMELGKFWEHLTCSDYEEQKNVYSPSLHEMEEAKWPQKEGESLTTAASATGPEKNADLVSAEIISFRKTAPQKDEELVAPNATMDPNNIDGSAPQSASELDPPIPTIDTTPSELMPSELTPSEEPKVSSSICEDERIETSPFE